MSSAFQDTWFESVGSVGDRKVGEVFQRIITPFAMTSVFFAVNAASSCNALIESFALARQ